MFSRSQRLFIDGRKLGDGGIGTFIETLIDGLLECEGRFQVILLVSSHFQDTAPELILKWQSLGIRIETDNTKKYSLLELLFLPLRWRRLLRESDWYLSPHYTLPYFIPCRSAVVIHDLIHLQYPENILHKVIAPALIKSAMRRASLLLTVAPHIKKQLEIYQSGCLRKDEIYCVPNATAFVNIERKNLIDHGGSEKIFRILFVGADRPHKQVKLYLRFLKSLKDADVIFRGVLVSRLCASTEDEIVRLGLQQNMELLAGISRENLRVEYQRADLFVNTSLEEGFCIPLLDALAARVPVLCPDLEFSRGLASSAGWFYKPGSVEDMHRQFAALLANQSLRELRLDRGHDLSEKFTPREQALALMRSLESHE